MAWRLYNNTVDTFSFAGNKKQLIFTNIYASHISVVCVVELLVYVSLTVALIRSQNPLHSSSSSLSSESSCQKTSDLRKLSAALNRHRKKIANCRRSDMAWTQFVPTNCVCFSAKH